MEFKPCNAFRLVSRSFTWVVLGFASALILTVYARPSRGQGFEVRSNSEPSVIGAGIFVSRTGRFSIALPQMQHAFGSVSVETSSGRATGDSYSWRMKEGTFSVGFVDAPQSPNEPQAGKDLLTKVLEATVTFASSNNGKLSERPIIVGALNGKEVRIEFASGVIIHRLFLMSRRLYQIILVVKSEKHIFEGVAGNVLDSFKVLNEADVAAALKAEAAKAEPSPLPQEPVAQRHGTDAGDEGLHGRVKIVFTESEDLSGTWSVQTRKPNSMEYYNERGDRTKRDVYDYKGNLSDITAYGYLDGARVSLTNTISHEYNPPPMMIATGPGEAKPKYDPRYSNKFDFKYDDQKRLIEKTWINNDGKLWLRYVYKYSGNQRDELVYSANGSLNQRYLLVLDDKGNEIEQTSYEVGGEKVRAKYSYSYEFDAKGNWTKRTTSKWVTKDGRSYYEPQNVYYRAITYY